MGAFATNSCWNCKEACVFTFYTSVACYGQQLSARIWGAEVDSGEYWSITLNSLEWCFCTPAQMNPSTSICQITSHFRWSLVTTHLRATKLRWVPSRLLQYTMDAISPICIQNPVKAREQPPQWNNNPAVCVGSRSSRSWWYIHRMYTVKVI